jgi:hypothetical protein
VPVGYGGDALELIDDVGVLNLPAPGAETSRVAIRP